MPFPGKPAGTVDNGMPFDHVIVVMMENHSFDNLLGSLPLSNTNADGLTFNVAGEPTNSNPGTNATPAKVSSFNLPNTAQGRSVVQSWKDTHEQINGGAMDGFVRSVGAVQPMGYYTPDVLPFAYSLAETFTLANRWFASMPGPTYPNRRFLMAGTAYGGTVTDFAALADDAPPNGTIFDSLSQHNINWSDYYTDVPYTALIPSILENHGDHHHPISEFFQACQAGTLPAVSFVDPGLGVESDLASFVTSVPPVAALLTACGFSFQPTAETQEDPQDMYYGEAWAHKVIEAVVASPKWARTLLIYTYDEHGGYYDHVPPPAAIPPDNIAPKLQPGDPPGAYNMYGPRVPAIVVSPYSKPWGVTNVVHDHTSVLATIEAKWNLPALTNRDANAATVMDFLDVTKPPRLHPPAINPPTGPTPGH